MRLKREKYLQMIRPYYEADLIKVITGIRRSGKSVLLESIRDELIEGGTAEDHVIYLNLEDLDYGYIRNAADLHREIKDRIRDDQKYYLFLDEIQHVEEFEKALASFRAVFNTSVFVTGSNSTLLSGELATLLTGRTIEFEVFPFSFAEAKEYLELNGKDVTEDLIYDYIKWGGFPLRFDFYTEDSVSRYLNGLYESIVNRDILANSRSIDRKRFHDIAGYALANAGRELSVENIVQYCSANHKDISRASVYNYLDRMKKAYLIHSVGKYNISGKKLLKNKEKYYAADNGLRTVQTNTIDYDKGFYLENMIYNELLSRGYTVFVGNTYKGEVDFIAVKNGKKCFLQVCYLLSEQNTIDREFGAYSPIRDASPKYVLSLDKMDLSRDGIIHMNITDFLLGRKDLMLS